MYNELKPERQTTRELLEEALTNVGGTEWIGWIKESEFGLLYVGDGENFKAKVGVCSIGALALARQIVDVQTICATEYGGFDRETVDAHCLLFRVKDRDDWTCKCQEYGHGVWAEVHEAMRKDPVTKPHVAHSFTGYGFEVGPNYWAEPEMREAIRLLADAILLTSYGQMQLYHPETEYTRYKNARDKGMGDTVMHAMYVTTEYNDQGDRTQSEVIDVFQAAVKMAIELENSE